MKKEIHIWDLPTDKVYITLKKEFREKFFNEAKDVLGSWNKLGNYLNVKRGDTLISYNWRKGKGCFPLEIAFKICDLINLSKLELEYSIYMIKAKTYIKKRGGNSGKPIVNSKLPIKIDEDFVEILGHICGDGTISSKNPNKGIRLGYINSDIKLIDNFKELIKKVFGNIEPYIATRDKGLYTLYTKPNYYLQYPTIISLFVLSVFDYKTRGNMNIPKFIFELPTKMKCRFLRALFDDEGTVRVCDKTISIALNPLLPLKNIRKLLIEVGLQPSRIYHIENSRGLMNRIDIMGENNINLFRDIVGFKHTSKLKKLNFILKTGWVFQRYKNYEAKKEIISYLKRKTNVTTSELSKHIKRSLTTTRIHLSNLRKEDLIFNIKKKDRVKGCNIVYNLWYLR